MEFKKRSLIAGALMSAAVIMPGAVQPASALEDGDRAEIETIVREYLLENPELLIEMSNLLQERQEAESKAQQEETISSAKDAIFNDPNDPVLGNPDGDVTVVEFFDYNCGYCKRAMSDMTAMLESDADLKFVLKEFPVLGPASQEAHKVALAFQQLHPEKYPQFHLQLLGFQGRADGESAMRIAKSLGADEAKMQEAIDHPKTADSVNETYKLAEALGINGTPAYVIGDEVIAGALGKDVLEEKVANVRQCGSATC